MADFIGGTVSSLTSNEVSDLFFVSGVDPNLVCIVL